jgi:hypothetical protein
MDQPNIIQITAAKSGDYVNIYGLSSDGLVYEWFKSSAIWKLCKTQSRDNDAF